MTGPDQRSNSWIAGGSKPPLWVRLFGCVLLVVVAAEMVVKRGVVVGVVAAVVYGVPGLSGLLAWERMRDWSRRHLLFDSLLIVPLIFLAVAYCTRLSIGICVLIALMAGLPLGAVGFIRRRRARRHAP